MKTLIHKSTLAAAIVGALASSAAPAFAQRAVRAAPQGQVIVNGQIPAYVAPSGCVSDEGYGRFTSCDNGVGQ